MSISRHLDMPSALDELGVQVHEVRGDEVWAWCPSEDHLDERHPQHWSINSESGDHLCFSCGFAGNLEMLVAERMDFRFKMRLPEGEEQRLDLNKAREWIRERGMSLDALKRLPSWQREPEEYVPPMGESLLAIYDDPPVEELEKRALDLESCQKYGVLWDHRESTWITPVRDPYDHTLWGWQAKGNGIFKNYPVGIKKSRTLFGLDAFAGGRAILLESPLDVVRLDTSGIEGGLSTFGASISEHQMRVVLDVADEVIVATDNFNTDPAGRKAALTLLKKYSRRIPMRFLDYSKTDAKDVGDMTDEEIHSSVKNSKHAWRGRQALGAA